MLQALGERGVTPDLLVGSSAGALNAAFVAGHGTGRAALEELGGLWRSLRRRDVFLLRPVQGVLALAGRRTSLFSPDPLRRLVEAQRRVRRPARGTDRAPPGRHRSRQRPGGAALSRQRRGRRARQCRDPRCPPSGPPSGSAARRRVHHPAHGDPARGRARGRRRLPAADRVSVRPPAAPRSAVGTALQALTLLSQQQLVGEVSAPRRPGPAQGAPAAVPARASPRPTSATRSELITRAHEATGSWIDAGGPDLPDPRAVPRPPRPHPIRTAEDGGTGDDGSCPAPVLTRRADPAEK